jgi:anti-anti-sigma factor
MASSPATLRMHRQDDQLTLQLEGRASMHQRLPIRRVAEEALAGGARRLRIDLRRCESMDSTVLGTLLALSRTAPGGLVLLAPSESCRQLLRQMGLAELFPVEQADELPAEAWTDASSDRDDMAVFAQDVVTAHESLAALPGPVGAAFRGVAQRLQRERPPGK